MTNKFVQSFINRTGLRKEAHSEEHLERIASAFSCLPYENITKIISASENKITGQQFRMPGTVLDDFERYASGGTCFSLTFTLMEILRYFGYSSRPVMADMNHGDNIHCALMVMLNDRELLIDPGYLIFRPIGLPDKKEPERKAPNGSIILKAEAKDKFSIFTNNGEEKKYRYTLKTAQVSQSDFEQHWKSSFKMAMMHSLVITGYKNGEQLYLRNDYFRKTGLQGKSTSKIKHNYHRELEKIFGISSELVLKALHILEEDYGRKLKVSTNKKRDD